MLSVLGFLHSLQEDQRTAARAALEEALERGPGDGWVTTWNLANVAARDGVLDEARELLETLRSRLAGGPISASAVFWVPGRPAHASLVRITEDNAIVLLDLQLALLGGASGAGVDTALKNALAACVACADEEAQMAAEWATATRAVSDTPGLS